MAADSSDRFILLNRLAEEFADRYRRGERPSLKEYADRHPELADDIREFFPALAEMEQVKEDRRDVQGAPDAGPLPPLERLGDYRIVREIGRGGMGVVYEAEQVSLGRHVALKVLPHQLPDGRAKQRFEREARAAAKLHHTNIVPVYGVGEHDGLPYYVMQFIHGLGLDEVLVELKRIQPVGPVAHLPGGQRQVGNWPHGDQAAADVARSLVTGQFAPAATPDATVDHAPDGVAAQNSPDFGRPADTLPLATSSAVLPGAGPGKKQATYWQSVARIGVQVADALEHAHRQGILHRDVKPSNLLLDRQGTVWVTDFGLAKADDQQNLTHTGDVLGTLRYMPPEAFDGKADARGDVYSLGLTLYELLALRPAFDETDRNKLIKQVTGSEPSRLGRLSAAVPRDLATVVEKAIERDPCRRYQTAGELAADLQRFLDDVSIRARRIGPWERGVRWARRRPAVAALLAVCLLSGLSLLVGGWWYNAQLLRANQDAEGRRQDAERERQQAVTNLYHSLVGEAQVIRRLRDNGYRLEVWDRLKQARALKTPDKDLTQLRQEAVACLGDFIGLAPTTWTDFPSDIRSLEVHPGAPQVAVGLEDGTLLLRDLTTGAEIARLHEHREAVVCLSFAGDGSRLASADRAGVVKLWQANPGGKWACTRTIPLNRPVGAKVGQGGETPIRVALSPDGKSLVTYSAPQRAAALWNCADGTRTTTFALPGSGELYGLAWSPDGKLLAAAYNNEQDHDHRVLVWEVTQAALRHSIASDVGRVNEVRFSGGGEYLAYSGAEGGALLVAPRFRRHNFVRFGICASVHFSPDDKLVAFADWQLGSVRLSEVATNREVAVLKLPWTRVVRFSQDGPTLVAAGDWGAGVRLWKLAAAREKLALRAHPGGTSSVAFSPDGKLLASAGRDRTVRVWDPATGRVLRELTGFRSFVNSVAFSPDGALLAATDWGGGLRFWHLPSGRELPAPRHPLGPVIYACAFSPDGRFFAACGQGGLVLWKVAANPGDRRPDPPRLWQQMARPSERLISSLRFSPDGNLLAWTPKEGNRLHLWDVGNSRPYPYPKIDVSGPYRNLAFYRDGRHLAFIRPNRGPEVWNVRTGQRVYPSGPDEFRGEREQGRIAAALGGGGHVVALSADDAWLAAQTVRGSVAVFDLHKEFLLTLPEEGSAVWGLAWSPNREFLAASFADGGVEIWHFPSVRARLAEIGLDWQDAPAAPPSPADVPGVPVAPEAARLFSLELFDAARATRTTEGNVCRVEVTAVDGINWHARLTRVFEDLQEGATYTVRFRARADVPRPIFLYGQIDEPDWHGIGLSQDVPLTDRWQTYQYQFRAKGLAAENMISFLLGDRTGTVWIADFTLTKGAK